MFENHHIMLQSQLLKKANGNFHTDTNFSPTEAGDHVRIKKAAEAYKAFMLALGFDFEADPHSEETPMRVAKAWVNDLARGCYQKPPHIKTFDNTEKYDGCVFQGNIDVKSMCSHHHLPFIGKAHVAYIPHPEGKMIGLSKLNRVVEWFARRPQVQESLTMQIFQYLNEKIEKNQGIAVLIEASHLCACVRGVNHNSTMQTAKLSGFFFTNEIGTRDEFYQYIANCKK